MSYAVIAFTRVVRRETLRDAVFLWTTPFWLDLIRRGSAAFSAASAEALLPDAMASSTDRTPDFRRVRRLLLTSVRRMLTRVARFAEDVLAISGVLSNALLAFDCSVDRSSFVDWRT